MPMMHNVIAAVISSHPRTTKGPITSLRRARIMTTTIKGAATMPLITALNREP